jgi:hypothetical protein
MRDQALESVGISCLEPGVAGCDAEELAGVAGKDDRRRHDREQDQAQHGRVNVGGELAPPLTVAGARQVLGGRGAVRRGRVRAREPAPGEQAQWPRVGERVVQVAAEQAGQGHRGIGEAILPAEPGLLHREVQPLLATEVIRDEVLADARPLGDVAHPGAGEALGGELLQRGVEQGGPGPVGVDVALVGCWRAAGPASRGAGCGHRQHRNQLDIGLTKLDSCLAWMA